MERQGALGRAPGRAWRILNALEALKAAEACLARLGTPGSTPTRSGRAHAWSRPHAWRAFERRGALGAPGSARTRSGARMAQSKRVGKASWKPSRPRRPIWPTLERRGALRRARGRAWRTLNALEKLFGSPEGRGGLLGAPWSAGDRSEALRGERGARRILWISFKIVPKRLESPRGAACCISIGFQCPRGPNAVFS